MSQSHAIQTTAAALALALGAAMTFANTAIAASPTGHGQLAAFKAK